MLAFQVLVIMVLLGLSTGLLRTLFKKFKRTELAGFLVIPLVIFSLGFSLRLSGKTALVDLGFCLTEFSSLFVSVLFTAFLFLGQLKYWKK